MAFQLILISGLPGCGKTSLAKSIVANSRLNIKHFEADDYFTSNGVLPHPGKPEMRMS
jgi:adenylate kinase family enzyme